MKALRIILTQYKACYKKEEADLNKMTYPLPPFSTVIGALHSACGFKSCQPMNISIQGTFGSMGQEVYRDHAFLNSLQNDRGTLVKLANDSFLSTGFTKVAAAQKSQGNDFEKEITIEVLNRECLTEYQQLKASRRELDEFKKAELDPKIGEIKNQLKLLKEQLKEFEKNSENFNEILKKRELLKKEQTELEQDFNTKKKFIDEELSKFATLTTSIKYYEVLYDVNLVLHIESDPEALEIVQKNIFNLRCLGRSEDFVDVKSCEIVELSQEIDDIANKNSAYVKVENVRNGNIFARGTESQGTKYYLNKNYTLKDGKRVFQKEPVLYISGFNATAEEGDNSGIYIDSDGFIVNFV